MGTPEVKKAAEVALLGGDASVKAFITDGYAAAIKRDSAKPSAFASDRQRVYQLLALGGGQVNKAADAALGSGNHADTRYFLEYGFADAQELDNRMLAYRLLDQAGQELRAAASVGLDGSRAGLQAFATVGQLAAVERDKATAAHVAAIDAMIGELAGLADKATLDAGQAADAAKAAEAAAAAEAAKAAQARGGNLPQNRADASQLAGFAPTGVPWPLTAVPPAALAVTGEAPDGGPLTAERPNITEVDVPPAGSWPTEAVSPESRSQEAAAPLTASSTGLNGWTIGLIIALVLAAAGAITFLLRRKVRA